MKSESAGPSAQTGAAQTGATLTGKVATGAAWMVAWRMASRLLGFASTLVLARVLVPADFGLVAIATAFSQSIDAFSEMGLRNALIRHEEEGRDLYDTAFSLQAIRGLLTAIVIVAAAPFTGAWFGDARLGPILIILAGLAFLGGFENVGVAEFRRGFRFHMEFVLQLLPRLLQVVVAVAAALIFHSYWALIAGIATTKIVRLVMTYTVHPYRPRFAISRWRELGDFAFWTWAASLASTAWNRSDAFIVGAAFGAKAVGVYLIAVEIATLPLTEFVAPATAAMFPGFAEATRNGRQGAMSPVGITVAMTCLFVPVAIAISVNAAPVVAVLLGAQWQGAVPLVTVAAWLCAISPVSFIASTVLIARNELASNFVIVTISALARIALLLAAARTGNLTIVVWAALASVVIEGALFATRLRRTHGEHRARIAGAVLRIAFAGVATLALVVAWGGLLPATSPLAWSMPWSSAIASTAGAIAHGAASGTLLLLAYAVVILAVWHLMGRPDGPETAWMRLLRSQCARLPRPAWSHLRP